MAAGLSILARRTVVRTAFLEARRVEAMPSRDAPRAGRYSDGRACPRRRAVPSVDRELRRLPSIRGWSERW